MLVHFCHFVFFSVGCCTADILIFNVLETHKTVSAHGRTIVHIDVDCFYAQVEMIRNPSLRDKPLGKYAVYHLTGNLITLMSFAMLTMNAFKSGIQQKYIIVTCNYEARKYGVTKLMLISEALKKCPNLVIVKGEDLTHYREMSYKITSKCSICLQYLIFNIAALSQF